MAYEVFISHSSRDKPAADAICAGLEARGIRCWIAPRDVLPGTEWTRSIVEAIEGCKVFLLVLTDNSNQSSQAIKELDCAVNHGKTIIPFRLEDIKPSGSMEYYLGSLHWLDALTPPLEKHIEELANYVGRILNIAKEPVEEQPGKESISMAEPAIARPSEAVPPKIDTILPPIPIPPPPVVQKQSPRKIWVWIAGAALAFVVIGAGIVALFRFIPGIIPGLGVERPASSTVAMQTAIPMVPAIAPAAKGIKVCMVTDSSGINDRSFNAAAWKGVTEAKDKLGIEGKYLESMIDADYEKNINIFIDEKCDLIMTVGFNFGVVTKIAAENHPDIKFSIVDYSYAPPFPNVVGQVFQTDEAAFLAGYLSAGLTKSGAVGTFGGMQIPTVTIFMDGFARGVEYYNERHAADGADVKMLGWNIYSQTGLFTGDFTDPQKGYEAASSLIDQGADIILPVAGFDGTGAAAAAKDHPGVYVIGVDVDWQLSNPEYQELILTSVLKRIDTTTLAMIQSVVDDNFKGGVIIGNLANGGVGLAAINSPDYSRLTGLQVELEGVRNDIISGKISLNPDYTQ